MGKELRDFVDIFTDIDDGHPHEEATKQLRRLVQAVAETGRNGSVTIKIDAKTGKRGMLIVGARVTTKIPTGESQATCFYTDEVGGLHLSDPKQKSLPMIGLAGGSKGKDDKGGN